jgi:hypothetical protein
MSQVMTVVRMFMPARHLTRTLSGRRHILRRHPYHPFSATHVPGLPTDEPPNTSSALAGGCGCGGVLALLPAVNCSSKSSAMAASPEGCRGAACCRACGGGSPHKLNGSSGDGCAAGAPAEAAADPADAVCCAIGTLLNGSSLTARGHHKNMSISAYCRFAGISLMAVAIM